MGDWTVILVSFTSNGLKRRDCNNCDHYETLETEPSKNYTLSFGTNGTYHSTSVDAIDLSHVQIGDNGGNNSQVKNGYITVTLKADGILTINGYNGYTVYEINDGTTTEVVTDSTYRYVATEDVTLTIVADPDGTGNNYFLSLDINYPVIVNENTALDLSATGAHIERTTGTYEFLYIDATSGKFADNNGGWVQVNAGTIITLYVRDRAEVLLNAYNSVDNFEISIVDGVCTIKVVGNDYINSITINYPVVVEENTLIDLSATGANIQGGKGTYGPLYVNATSGKFADNNSGWVQVNAGTIITINVLDGARVYIKAYTSVENFEIVVANGVCTITVNANDYLEHIVVEYEHSYNEGVVTAPTCETEGYTTYTCELCGHSYTGDVTEKAAHTAGEAATENVVGATCTEAGSYDNVTYCTVCDAEISRETVTVPATGHKDTDNNGACDACNFRLPVEKTSTLTFDANKANRTEFSTTKQVWSANGITLTNNKGASTNAVADYANPVRLYKSSEVIIEATGMTKIVFKCSGGDYVLKLTATSEYTVSTSGTTVTVTFNSPVDSFTIASLANQTRFSSIDVTTLTEAPTLESISAEGMNTTYTVGDELSLEGLVVKATLSDGSINVLEEGDYTVDTSAVVPTVAGTYTIVISYNDGFDTREVEITVEYKAATVTGITVSDMKTAYYTGETLNTNATITATYSDGTIGTLALTEFNIDVSAVNNKVGGTYNVVFTYINDETITYTVQVTYTERTLTEVITLADNTVVVVTGTVARIETAYSEQYGNISVYISDDNGNQLYLYRLTGNVTVGQIIRVSGTITTYGGARQIAQGATFEVVGTHECSKWTDATCSAPAKCIVCSKANGEALPHTPGAAATCEDDQICTVCEIVLVEALGHDYEGGVCNNCGEAEPSEGEEPGVIAGGRDDFSTKTSTSTSYSTVTTTAGWKATNSAIFSGGSSNSSPKFSFISTNTSVRAFCMNGKTSAVGTITSPTLTTGISKLTFKYGLPFGDTKIKFRVDIIQDGKVVATKTINPSSVAKLTAYTETWVLDKPVLGEFQIKFTNLSPSNSTSNKDRTAIWDIQWDGWGYES